MKLSILILLLSPLMSYNQIAGVGLFKIDITSRAVIDTIIKQSHSIRFDTMSYQNIESQTTLDTIFSTPDMYDVSMNSKQRIFKVEKDPDIPNRSDTKSFLFSDVNVYFINEILISTIPVYNLYLTFYKDTLIQFQSDLSEDFIEAMDNKFGKATLVSEEKTISCQNGFGAITYHKEFSSRYTWHLVKKNIRATGWDAEFYNDKCKLVHGQQFTLENISKMNFVLSKESLLNEKSENEKKKQKVKTFKDF